MLGECSLSGMEEGTEQDQRFLDGETSLKHDVGARAKIAPFFKKKVWVSSVLEVN